MILAYNGVATIFSERELTFAICRPYEQADESELCEMFECIKIGCDNNRSVLIMGDFNYPSINWTTLKSDNNGYKFLKLVLEDCYLDQHVPIY